MGNTNTREAPDGGLTKKELERMHRRSVKNQSAGQVVVQTRALAGFSSTDFSDWPKEAAKLF